MAYTMAQAMGTAVSVLQEFTQHKHYPLPIYDLVDSQSGTHDNTFRYKVSVQDQYAIGVGKSKKEAKQEAARSLLEVLTGKRNYKVEDVAELGNLPIGSQQANLPTKFYGSPAGMNQSRTPVSVLQELTQRKNHPLPIYNFMDVRANPYQNEFQYSVQLQGLRAVGVGSTKKDAKHNAAENMLELLAKREKCLPEELDKLTVKLNDNLAFSKSDNYDNTLRYEVGAGEPIEEAKIDAVQKFPELLIKKEKNLEKREEVQECVLNPEDLWKVNHPLPQETNIMWQQNITNAVGILQELLAKRNYPPPNYILVHSSTGTHINVFHYKVEVLDDFAIGTGSSKKEAKHDAAQKMLQLLANKRKPQLEQCSDVDQETKPEQGTIPKSVPSLDDAWRAHHSLFKKINIEPPPALAGMTKTSVSILQEIMAQKNYPPPNYELVDCKAGTHDNTFRYKVQVRDDSAIGVGKSKKEAKHDAAQQLLDLLANKRQYRQEKSSSVSRIRSPETVEYTGAELIQSQEVRTLAEKMRNTKLFISQEALNRIMDVLPELKESCQLQDMEITDRDMDAQEKYNLIFNPQKINLNTSVSDFDQQFRVAMREKEIQIETVQKYFQMPKTEETLENLLNEFGCIFSLEEMQITPVPIMMLSINCDVPLSFMEMGANLNEAKKKVLENAFKALEVFMLT